MTEQKLRNILTQILITAAICLIFFCSGTAQAASAINQLCGAAGYGAG
jgi:hypothetical protein